MWLKLVFSFWISFLYYTSWKGQALPVEEKILIKKCIAYDTPRLPMSVHIKNQLIRSMENLLNSIFNGIIELLFIITGKKYEQIKQHGYTGCPKKHGNSVTNSISSLLWVRIVLPNLKSHNIIMSARIYFLKTVKDCEDVSILSPQDEQQRRTSLLCMYTAMYNR